MAIDDKVVSISFESSKFEQGVNAAISALEKLKASLHFPSAGKGLDDINASAKKVDLSHIAKGVDDIKGKLSALSVAALAVFANIAQKAVSAGARFVKAFTLDPIKAGFQEYSTNLNAVQTILANTAASGAKLKDVNAALKELNTYSDKTIYNFSQMAKNIGTFTAAGVDLKTATASIKGIANLAALSGSNAEQASTAMYQLSQAIAAGRVSLQDWNSVVNAGMGGTVFQRALAQTAEAMGTLKKGTVELVGPMKNVQIAGESFRQSIQAGPGKQSWLTSKVLTSTLQQFTGDLSKAELKAQGFNDAQIKAIQSTAQTAMHAATEVKTLSQVLDVAKETAGSGWAQTWQIIFGNFGEAKTTFTALSNAINGVINTNANARNKILADWKALGGRTVLIDSIKTAFHNLGLVIKPIKEAFRDIFPATTGRDLYNLTLRFQDFANALKPSAETIDGLKRTFRGLFAIWDIGYTIIGKLLGVFGKLFGAVGDGSGSFLQFTGSIGDFLVKIDKALKKSESFDKFFSGLGDVLAVPIKLLGDLAGALGDLFGGFSSGGFSSQITGMTKAMTPFQRVIESISISWSNFVDSIGKSQALQSALDAIITLIEGLGSAIGHAAANMNFEAILQVIRTGLLGGIALMLKNFFGKGSFLDQISKGFAGGIIGNIAGSFKALEGSMVAMQQNIKAKTLKEIAIAIALLTASVVALSFVDPTKVNAAIASIGFMMGELLGAMKILDTISKTGGFIKLPIIAAGLILFAGAIDTLVIAVLALSRLDWNQLVKGLTGVGALLGGISAAVIPLSANSAGMIRAGLGMTAIALALNLLALAVKQLGSMDLSSLGKGLGAVAIGLGTLVAAMTKMPTAGMIKAGIGVLAIATGLKVLASAIDQMGSQDMGTLAKGLGATAIALGIMVVAMRTMPNAAKASVGLLLMALALGKIADAVVKMGGMSIEQIAKGLGTLAGALAILIVALTGMEAAIPGAIALGVAATGISLLAGALAKIGGMSWADLAKGLIALGLAFTVIGVAGAAITAAVPGLLGFGAAMLLIGAGLALAGAGIFLIATGLSALVVAAPTGVGVLIKAFQDLQKGIIENVKLLILGLLEIVKALADTAPQFVDALVKILNSLLDVIIQASPKVGQAFNALITMALQVLRDNQGRIIQAGFDLLLALLNGIKNNIGQLITTAVDVVTRFLGAIANNIGRIVTAGVSVLTALLKGIAQGIGEVATAATNIITRFITAIAGNVAKVAAAGLTILTAFLNAIASHLGDVIRAGTNMLVSLINGVGNAVPRLVSAATNAIIKFINAVAQASVKLVDAGMKAIIYFLNGVANAINANAGEMRAAGMRVGIAIIDGMTFGLVSKAQSLYGQIESIMGKAMGLLHKIPGVHSPSTVTYEIGQEIANGLALGMESGITRVSAAATTMSNAAITRINAAFVITAPDKSEVMRKIGSYLVHGFAEGLMGDPAAIQGAIKDMNDKLTQAMSDARKTIEEEKKKLKELRDADKPDAAAIREAQKIIEQNQALLARAVAGHQALTGALRDERTHLLNVSKDYQVISEKLKAAEQALADAQKTREDAVKSFTDQYSALPSIVTEDAEGNAIDQLATYEDALKHQADAVAAYQSTLDQLRQLGLDDKTYQKLLQEGTADQAFATQLLSGGKTAVDGLNALDKQLDDVSKTLATNAANNLYQAGVDAAAGLVNGLKAKKAELAQAMEELAIEIVQELKKQLKIKSPSEVFAEIGKLSMEGLAKGFSTSSKIVTDAVTDAADDALTAMQKSMRDISDIVTNELNPNPVITPVLDLTQIRAQAGELGALTTVPPLTASTSFGQASIISSDQTAARAEEPVVSTGGTSVKFEQNNYSPESLSEIEIYRQTKNQLSQLKSVLALS